MLVWLWNCQHEIEHPFQVPQVLYTSDTPENQSAEASPSPKCYSPVSLLIIRPIARSIKVAAASCMIASCQVLTHTNTRLDNYREMQQKKSSKLQQWMQCNIENSHRKTITAKCNRRKAKNYNNWCNAIQKILTDIQSLSYNVCSTSSIRQVPVGVGSEWVGIALWGCSLNVLPIVIVYFGQVMSHHHSDQMPQKSQGLLFECVLQLSLSLPFYRTHVNLGSDLWVRMSVRLSQTFFRLNWCDSGWWRYQLNTNW